MQVLTVETSSLGDRSYLITDGKVAAVIDPQRDIDRVLERADRLGVRITHVAETHLHNDYVTGGLALAKRTGADYLVPESAGVSFDRHPVRDGEVISLGSALALRVLATPGHTFHHVSYSLEAKSRAVAIFSGGSLLLGSVGRTDLVAPEHTTELSRAQYASAHRLAGSLPPDTAVYPTHGFGSFCSATQSSGHGSTIGVESKTNPALIQSEQEFVDSLIAGLDAYPAYYAHMSTLNAAGPGEPNLSMPRPVAPAELRRRIDSGEWVIDLRSRQVFAAGHVPGTINFGLDGSLATYLGWLLPWGSPLTLLGEDPEQVAQAQRELCRIGLDQITGAATGDPDGWEPSQPLRTLVTADFEALSLTLTQRHVVVLDVRLNQEWHTSHIPGAVHIPLHELPGRIPELPPGEVWVHCAGGYRAAVAASLLQAAGREAVAVDDDYQAHAAAVVANRKSPQGQGAS
ncbi:MAG: rhodanese-like domain-containing protein [Mycobacteriales bacterium]